MIKRSLLYLFLVCLSVPVTAQTCQSLFQANTGNCPSVVFTDFSTAGPGDFIVAWSWDFGDGNTSNVQNPTHQYAQNGSYVVCLNIVTANFCTSVHCDTITISCLGPPQCQAFYQYTLGQCPTVSFFDGSTSSPGTITNYSWDFGDGTSSTLQNPSHTYTANGSYVVCETIFTSDSCQSTHCDTITINCIAPPTCQAAFQYTLGLCPTVSFFDGSTSSPGTITNYSWDFGDGTNSTMQNPSHTYTANGTYVVCLAIFTTDACQSVHCDTITISCIQPPATCQAFYQYTLGQCPTVSFFDGSTSSPGTITNYSWDFGDGTSSTLQNPSHTYTANGSYVVCETIFTSDSCQSTHCDTITISCISQPTCQAAFQYSASGCPQIFFFDASSSSPGTITSYFWDFGDGSSSTSSSPTHTYTANGTYVVCETIFTSDSCQSTHCDTLTISCIQPPTCQAAFQYTLGQCPNVSFFDASTSSPGTISGHSWDFGDGGSSTASSPSHTYTANGTYVVCLTIFTTDSCQSTQCDTITISCISQPTCQAAFQYSASGCPQIFFFDASSSSPGTITSYFWDFGDGTSSTSSSPTHTYTANGTYVVCETIVTSDSCQSTHCDTITISCIQPPTCQAAFQYTLGQCPNVSFFDASSSSPGTISSHSWDFGDGGSSTASSPSHTYTANGTYVVCLTIFTTDSCQSTHCDTITISCISQPTCQAAFQYTLGLCPTVSFFDGSSSSPGTITTWSWDFGDGTSSSMQNPSHTYTANGSYLACLTIFTSDSCQSTYCDTVTITCVTQPTCQAAFQWTFGVNGCPTADYFDASTASPGGILSWAWDFGDGGSSGMKNPTHTYTTNGTYQVCLTIMTSDSCTSTWCDTIAITCITGPTCNAVFQWTAANDPTIDFFDGSTASPGTVTDWFWDFGDGGGSSTMQNPSYTYTSNGVYLVCLRIITSDSCQSTYCDSVTVGNVALDEVMAQFEVTVAPNPFSDEVRVHYVLTGAETVRIEVLDMAGKHIATLRDETQAGGKYRASWRPEHVANGMYLLRFSAGGQTGHAKLLLAR